MDFKFQHDVIINREKREATIRLYGAIGEKINGHYFAKELAYLDRNYDVVNIHINSQGGDFDEGLSIVSVMDTMRAQVNVLIAGVAASMAAVIAVAGDHVAMNDYALFMIHDPMFVDEDGKLVKSLSPKAKKALESVKGVLNKILTRRGKDAETIGKLMKNETWYKANDAETEGFVDEVIKTGQKKKLAALTPLKLVAKIMDETLKTKSKIKMKKLIAKFNLADDADETAIIAKVDAMETAHKDAVKVLIDGLIGFGKAAGLVTDKNETKMRALAEKDAELFTGLVDPEKLTASVGDNGERISASIAELIKLQKGGEAVKSFTEYSADELREMKASNLDGFKKIYKAYHGEEYQD